MTATSQIAERFHDYDGFVEKFKPKKTTDDCYTPPEVFEVVVSYVIKRFGVRRADIVRPFYPGGDFENFDYPKGAVVVDNPPFSILARIQNFYLDKGIKFFLFAPTLTMLSGSRILEINHIACGAAVSYENGAKVSTSFITNLGPEMAVMETEPRLRLAIEEASTKAAKEKKQKQTLPKYEYPDAIATAAMFQRYSKYGIDLKINRDECLHVRALDSQRPYKKTIFGGGLLLSERAAAERAAAERAAAERAAAERWVLSDREKIMQKMLGGE